MALKSTIYKAELSIADNHRAYYAQHSLTLAQHPSETEERLMVRLLAFIVNAHERLAFGKGLSADDEPDLWLKDYTEAIQLWVEVGLPDERRIRRACGRAQAVQVWLYGGSAAQKWWRDNQSAMRALPKVTVFNLPDTSALKQACQRSMNLHADVEYGEVSLHGDTVSATLALERLTESE